MVASRGSGKSYVTRDIIQSHNDIPGGIIISPTDRMSSFYGKFFPDVYIHYKYSSEIIETMLARQTEIIEKAKEKAKLGKRVDPRAILVMDDCLASKGSWAKDECIMEMFFNGRHYMVMYILTMQFPLGLGPELRGNFDYIFLLAEDYISNQKRIYEHYAGMFPNFNSFREVFKEITKDFGCMVIANRGARSSFLDKIFWYKASRGKNITIGCSQFNNFHKRNYRADWRKHKKDFDINTFVGKKRNASIKVAMTGPDKQEGQK